MKKLLTSALFIAVSFVTSHALAQDLQGDPKAGEKKIAMCIGCHGIKGYQASFPEVYRVPMISGQNAKYISNALAAYRGGERKHPTMRAIATSLTDQDIADIASYYACHSQAAPAPEKLAEPTGKAAELITKGACNSCHGANYSKGIDGSYPKLAGQNADYLYVALKFEISTPHLLQPPCALAALGQFHHQPGQPLPLLLIQLLPCALQRQQGIVLFLRRTLALLLDQVFDQPGQLVHVTPPTSTTQRG